MGTDYENKLGEFPHAASKLLSGPYKPMVSEFSSPEIYTSLQNLSTPSRVNFHRSTFQVAL